MSECASVLSKVIYQSLVMLVMWQISSLCKTTEMPKLMVDSSRPLPDCVQNLVCPCLKSEPLTCSRVRVAMCFEKYSLNRTSTPEKYSCCSTLPLFRVRICRLIGSSSNYSSHNIYIRTTNCAGDPTTHININRYCRLLQPHCYSSTSGSAVSHCYSYGT